MNSTIRYLLSGIFCLSAAFLPATTYEYRQSDNVVDRFPSPPPAGKQGQGTLTSQEITPIAGPRVADGIDIFITADFIWWKPRVDGLAYAQSGFEDVYSNFQGSGKLHQIDFRFEPGFKVGLGFNLGHDGWDIYAEYTWIHSHPGSSTTRRDDFETSNLKQTWISGDFSTLPMLLAQGTWDFSFNVLDLEMGRNFYISQKLALRPHFGLKMTWQDQDYRVRYQTSFNSGLVELNQKMRIDQDYWGIGIRTGLDTTWHLGYGFSIFGNWALTAMWSDFEVDRKDILRIQVFNSEGSIISDDTGVLLNARNDFHTLKGVLEFDLGLRWDKWFSCDDYHLGLQAGWEEQIWWSNNQFIRPTEEAAHGDLTLHGLTVKARFDF